MTEKKELLTVPAVALYYDALDGDVVYLPVMPFCEKYGVEEWELENELLEERGEFYEPTTEDLNEEGLRRVIRKIRTTQIKALLYEIGTWMKDGDRWNDNKNKKTKLFYCKLLADFENKPAATHPNQLPIPFDDLVFTRSFSSTTTQLEELVRLYPELEDDVTYFAEKDVDNVLILVAHRAADAKEIENYYRSAFLSIPTLHDESIDKFLKSPYMHSDPLSLTYDGGEIESIELTTIELSSDATVECEETELTLFQALSVEKEAYSTPWSANPQTLHFGHWHWMDCYMGQVYSKDFAYFDCVECNRTICQQDPSCGWTTQYRDPHYLDESSGRLVCSDGEGYICTKCVENQINAGMFSSPAFFTKAEGGGSSIEKEGSVKIGDLWYEPTSETIRQPSTFNTDLGDEWEERESLFISSARSIENCNRICLQYCAEGLYPYVGIDRSGMGLEYEVTLYTKPIPVLKTDEELLPA